MRNKERNELIREMTCYLLQPRRGGYTFFMMCERMWTLARLLRTTIAVVQRVDKGLARKLRGCQEFREFDSGDRAKQFTASYRRKIACRSDAEFSAILKA